MPKLRNLDIIFDKIPVFAGQVLTGTLNFGCKEATGIKNISLSFEGSSNVVDGSEKSGKKKWYFRVEFPLTAFLFQFGTFNGKHKVPPGDHVIPFRFPVPPVVPNSFKGKHGYVYYCAKATLWISGGTEVKTEKEFPVIGIEDLNWNPTAALPLSFHEGYNQKVLCLNLADVSTVLQLKRSGYVPGEKIEISAEIMNKNKKKKVRKTVFQLVQTVFYKVGNEKFRETKDVVSQLSYPEIPPEGLRKLEDEPMEVPALPPSFLRGCENINIRYDFVLSVDPGIKIQVPVLIGTIPYSSENLRVTPPKALPWDGPIPTTPPPKRPPPRRTHSQKRHPKQAPPPPPPFLYHDIPNLNLNSNLSKEPNGYPNGRHPNKEREIPIFMTGLPSGIFMGPPPQQPHMHFNPMMPPGIDPRLNGGPPFFFGDPNFSMQQTPMFRHQQSQEDKDKTTSNPSTPLIYSPPSIVSDSETETIRKSFEAASFEEAGHYYNNGRLRIEEIE